MARRILVVEDDLDLRRMFRTALALHGYDVLEAGDGLHALRVLEVTEDLDALVLDLGLPILQGEVVLQDLAARARTQHVPIVVVVTGFPGPHGALQADCVLIKPVTPDTLIATLERCIAAGRSTHGA